MLAILGGGNAMQLESPARTRFAELVRREDPPLDEAACLAELDRLARRVRRIAPAPHRAASTLRALREALFVEAGFKGNDASYYDPRNSYLNQVLDRRLGIPISLSIVFMEVARRAGLRLGGVGFPGHFLVKYRPEAGPEVFIDPYNAGEMLTADECAARYRVHAPGRELEPRFLDEVPARPILGRMLHNLKRIYVEQGDDVRAFWVIDRLLLLDPGAAEEIRDRGLVSARLGLAQAAARDLAEYLARVPAAPDVGEVRDLLASMRSRPSLLN